MDTTSALRKPLLVLMTVVVLLLCLLLPRTTASSTTKWRLFSFYHNQNSCSQLLFTVDEETGLEGAQALIEGELLSKQAKYLINVDSEEFGEICLSCAGLLLSFFFSYFFPKAVLIVTFIFRSNAQQFLLGGNVSALS